MSSLFSLRAWRRAPQKSACGHRLLEHFKPRMDLLEDRRMLAGQTLWVDPNVAPVPNQVFGDIQSAVNAAHSSDTIKVVPGTYNESVTVPTSKLTIIGGQIFQPAFDSPGPSIVNGGAAQAFFLNANDIAIDHFTLESTTVGIETDGSHSGYKIVNDIFVDDPIGLLLNTTLGKSAHPTT